MKKIAFINQRYGLEVNGGSEYYSRLMAEHLKQTFEVEVITTKAVDYMTWGDYYTCDEEVINGVVVHRFPVAHEREQNKFNEINAKLLQSIDHTTQDEQQWVEQQGPYSPALIQYLEDSYNEYDAFVFVTYLYYTTSVGIDKVASKAILIPTAHDEPYIYFRIFESVFHSPKAIIYLTVEEKKFVQKKFHNEDMPNDTMAVGIEVPEKVEPKKFMEERGMSDYLIYVGRIDEGKCCHWLFRYFIEYKKRNPGELKLVLMGKSVIDIPNHPDIISLGFVSEEEKYNGIAGARALILPSEFESLSISVLEAFALSIPVLVNGRCEVLKGHCKKSNAGLYYENYFEFEAAVQYMLNNPESVERMKSNAKEYIDRNFQWDDIVRRFENIVNAVVDSEER